MYSAKVYTLGQTFEAETVFEAVLSVTTLRKRDALNLIQMYTSFPTLIKYCIKKICCQLNESWNQDCDVMYFIEVEIIYTCTLSFYQFKGPLSSLWPLEGHKY